MTFERNQWETQERERLQGTNTECPPDSGCVEQSQQQSVTPTTKEGKLFPWAFCLHIVGWYVSNINLSEEQTDSPFNEVAVYSGFSYFTLGIVAALGLLRVLKATKVQGACMAAGALAGPGVLLYLNPFDAFYRTAPSEVALLEAMLFGVIAGDVLLGFYRFARAKLGISSSGY